MSVPFEIRYLPTAENDLDDIFDYIMMDNPSAAVSILEKFNHSISQLAFNPELGVVSKDDRLKKMGYRILIIGKYFDPSPISLYIFHAFMLKKLSASFEKIKFVDFYGWMHF